MTGSRPPRRTTPTMSPAEKVIRAHTELIEADMTAANGIMSAANGSADAARELAKELPAVQMRVNAVVNKVADMATEFAAAETAYREAKIAAAGGQKAVVETKAREVSNRLGHLKAFDRECKTLFETAQEAAEKKRAFKAITDEITGIQTGVQELVTKAGERATAAQEAVDQARAKLPVGALTGRAKVAAEKAQSITSSVRDAEAKLRDANNVAASLTTRLGEVTAALAAATAADTTNDKPAADAALESAKKAKVKAVKTATDAGIKEKDSESQPTETSPDTGGVAKEGFVEQLATKVGGRVAILVVEAALILLLVPGWLKSFFGVAWVILLILSLAPGIHKSPKWVRVFWGFAGAVLLAIALTYLLPMFGGGSVTDVVKNVPGAAQPTPTPSWKLK